PRPPRPGLQTARGPRGRAWRADTAGRQGNSRRPGAGLFEKGSMKVAENPQPKVEMPKSAGPVTPQPLQWRHRLAASLIYGLIELVAATLRFRWATPPEIALPEVGPFVFCIWHNRLSMCLVMYRHILRRTKQSSRLAAIVSASKDGGVVARIL